MKYLLFVSILIFFFSCKKSVDVPEPDFNVTVEKNTYGVKDTIVFNFIGSANIITFYSGERGKEYQFRERFMVDGKPQMQFTSYSQYGPQDTTLKLLVSSDFKNVFDVESLAQATWTDITSRAVLSTGTDNTPSGIIDLSDFVKKDTPIHIAFKYVAKKLPVSQPTWTIKNVLVENKLADSSLVAIARSSDISWGAINVLNTAKGWTYNTTQAQMSGGPIDTDDNEDWIISKPLSLNRVQRSLGVNVKNNPTALQTKYIFSGYTAPGTYTATFEAINANRWDSRKIVKEIIITVQ